MVKIRLGAPQSNIQVPTGFPRLSSAAPIAIDRSRYKGEPQVENCFVILSKPNGAVRQERWHLAPKQYCHSWQELRAKLLEEAPNCTTCAAGLIDTTRLDFGYVDERATVEEVRSFVIRAFAAPQMYDYWRYEQAVVWFKGKPLGEDDCTIAALLAFHGLRIPRRN